MNGKLNSNTLVVIPARAGSKGIPGKNHKLLGGKPLIAYTIECALGVFDTNQICISTNDPVVVEIAENYGLSLPFIRPEELATDNSTTQDVLIHAIEQYEKQGYIIDIVVLLQPTSPFRSTVDIEQALYKFTESCDMVTTVFETSSNPYFTLMEYNELGWLEKSKKGNITRRQDAPIVYELNGAVYVINCKSLKSKKISEFDHILGSVMSENKSIDLDTERDWLFAEYLMERNLI